MKTSELSQRVSHSRPLLQQLPLLTAALIGSYLFFEVNLEPLLTSPQASIIGGWDGAFYYFWLRSLIIDGDISFMNEVLQFNAWSAEIRERILLLPRTGDGLIINKYPIGWALLSSPWFILAHLLTMAANFFGAGLQADGYARHYQFAIVLGQGCYAAASLYLSYRLLKEHARCSKFPQVLFIVWLASFMLFYQTIELFMAHNAVFFALSGAFYFAARFRISGSRRAGLLSGVFGGLLIVCRPQAGAYLLYPLYIFGAAVLCSSSWRSRAGTAAAFILPLALIIAVQLIAWKAHFGTYFVYSYRGEPFHWLSPAVFKVLFSPLHGLFYWNPVYLFCFAALVYCCIRRPGALPVLLCISILLNLYINAAWHNWWFGASFGSRAFESATLGCFLGAALLFELLRSRTARAAAIAVPAVLAAWNVYLTAAAVKGGLPLDRKVSYSEMLRAGAGLFQ